MIRSFSTMSHSDWPSRYTRDRIEMFISARQRILIAADDMPDSTFFIEDFISFTGYLCNSSCCLCHSVVAIVPCCLFSMFFIGVGVITTAVGATQDVLPMLVIGGICIFLALISVSVAGISCGLAHKSYVGYTLPTDGDTAVISQPQG